MIKEEEMKQLSILAILIAAFLISGSMVLAQTADDVSTHKACALCGMDRGQFNFSRMLIKYEAKEWRLSK